MNPAQPLSHRGGQGFKSPQLHPKPQVRGTIRDCDDHDDDRLTVARPSSWAPAADTPRFQLVHVGIRFCRTIALSEHDHGRPREGVRRRNPVQAPLPWDSSRVRVVTAFYRLGRRQPAATNSPTSAGAAAGTRVELVGPERLLASAACGRDCPLSRPSPLMRQSPALLRADQSAGGWTTPSGVSLATRGACFVLAWPAPVRRACGRLPFASGRTAC
jgi:hypothetical protein